MRARRIQQTLARAPKHGCVTNTLVAGAGPMHYDKIDPVEKVAMRLVSFKNITIPAAVHAHALIVIERPA
jgi:hypothetical protein